MQVIKRDGRVMEFNPERIIKAVTLAMSQTPGGVDIDLANKIASSVQKQFEDKGQTTVYEIQDAVEKKLMASSRKEVAQSYITYRYNRDIARKSKNKEVFLDIIGAKSQETVIESTNKNPDTPAGMMMKFASETTKPFVDDFLLSREAREAVKAGYIYVHHKDYYPTKAFNCLQYPLDKILESGFKIGLSTSRPAKRIETASALAWIAIETVQNEMDGEQSIPAIDFYLAPFVKLAFQEEIKKIEKLLDQNLTDLLNYEIEEYEEKDLKKLTGKQRTLQMAINCTVSRVKQSMEAFVHNMNTIHSGSEKQVILSSINYGTDTSPEGRCIIKQLLLTTKMGIGYNETPTFPVQIWKKKKGINYLEEDPNYDLYELACQVASSRNCIHFLNLDATFNQNEKWKISNPKRYEQECSVMAYGTRVFEDRHGDPSSIGRGMLSKTTINLPKIAIEAAYEAQEKLGLAFPLGKDNKEEMEENYSKTIQKIAKQKIEQYAEIAAKQLYERYSFQGTAICKQFPLLMSGLWKGSQNLKPYDKVESVTINGTLGLGFIGLAEALIILTGKHQGESKKAQELGISIVEILNEVASQYADRYNVTYSIVGTKEEGLAKRFCKKDQKQYGVITGVTDKVAYTTSSHLPEEDENNIEEKAKIEAPYHELTKGGNEFLINTKQTETNELEGRKLTQKEMARIYQLNRETEEQKDDKRLDETTIKNWVDLLDKYNLGYLSIE